MGTLNNPFVHFTPKSPTVLEICVFFLLNLYCFYLKMHLENIRPRAGQVVSDDGARADDRLNIGEALAVAARRHRESPQVVELADRTRHAAHGGPENCAPRSRRSQRSLGFNASGTCASLCENCETIVK